MKTPGPDHPITIEPHAGRLRVTRDGVVIADTIHALVLKESSYPAVFYVPREDADMSRLVATTRSSHCPYKGDANYFSIEADGSTADNAVWSYEQPYPAMTQIAGHLAFYPDKVSFEQGVSGVLIQENQTKSCALSLETVMKIVNMHEAKTHLSRLVAEAANGEPFIIAKAGRSIVKVVPLDEPAQAAFTRVGFLAGQIEVPDDFDRMGQTEIEQMFGVDGA